MVWKPVWGYCITERKSMRKNRRGPRTELGGTPVESAWSKFGSPCHLIWPTPKVRSRSKEPLPWWANVSKACWYVQESLVIMSKAAERSKTIRTNHSLADLVAKLVRILDVLLDNRELIVYQVFKYFRKKKVRYLLVVDEVSEISTAHWDVAAFIFVLSITVGKIYHDLLPWTSFTDMEQL